MTDHMIRWTRFTILTGRTGPWLRYFFDYVVCFHYSSSRDDHLTHSPRAGHCFHSPHHIPDSSLTVELNRLFIATIVQPRIRNAPHPFMESPRMTPPCP
jgi:hypothetical protein